MRICRYWRFAFIVLKQVCPAGRIAALPVFIQCAVADAPRCMGPHVQRPPQFGSSARASRPGQANILLLELFPKV
jgi:hypothetical protein